MSAGPLAEQHAEQPVERAVAELVAAAIRGVAIPVIADAGDHVEIVATQALDHLAARVAASYVASPSVTT